MSDLVRFGVAMERGLLAELDEHIAARGYENRSEALRDLVRAELLRGAWDAGAWVVATLTIVVDVRSREVALRLAQIESDPAFGVVSAMRVPLGGERLMCVLAVRGRGKEIAALAGELGGTKGVLACELAKGSIAAPPAGP